MAELDLVAPSEQGLACPDGGFTIDPWRPVERAVITHAHADHAVDGCGAYLCAAEGEAILRERLGADARIEAIAYGERRTLGGVSLSLHPAGHVLGSAQVRLESHGRVWVVSGDYKTEPDGTCAPLEPLACHVFVSESTFGLPIYRWRPQSEVLAEIAEWWRENQARRRTSVLLAYALGKSQRILAGLDLSLGPVFAHGAVLRFVEAYRRAGVALPAVAHATAEAVRAERGRALVLAPPSALGGPWLRKLGPASTAFASGWMRLRGTRRRKSVDRGFALSDHADWDGLNATIRATGAADVRLTHGSTAPMARWLRERGLDASEMPTLYEGESVEDPGRPEA